MRQLISNSPLSTNYTSASGRVGWLLIVIAGGLLRAEGRSLSLRYLMASVTRFASLELMPRPRQPLCYALKADNSLWQGWVVIMAVGGKNLSFVFNVTASNDKGNMDFHSWCIDLLSAKIFVFRLRPCWNMISMMRRLRFIACLWMWRHWLLYFYFLGGNTVWVSHSIYI